MKTLILNFLFFVASALILVQCAMLFPSNNKIVKHQSQPKQNTGTANNKHGKLIATITDISIGGAEFKK